MWVLLLIYCFYIIKRNCDVPSHVHLYHHHTKPKTFYAWIYCMNYTIFLDYSGSVVLMTPLCNLSHSLMSPSPCWSFFFSPRHCHLLVNICSGSTNYPITDLKSRDRIQIFLNILQCLTAVMFLSLMWPI